VTLALARYGLRQLILVEIQFDGCRIFTQLV